MDTPDQEKLRVALDGCESIKLRNTFLFLKALIPFNEAHRSDCIDVEKLVAGGLRPKQIHDALEVMEIVHKNLHGPRDAKQGVRAVFTGPAYMEEVRGASRICGISTVPLYELDAELSRREGERPWDKKIEICMNASHGFYRCEDPDLKYPMRGRRREIIQYLLQHGAATFADIAADLDLGMRDSSFAVEVKEVNALFRKKLKIASDLIVNGSFGYQLNTAAFSFVGR